MKKIFLTFLAITVFLAAAPSYGLKAQDYVAPPVTVSKEKCIPLQKHMEWR